MMCDVARVLGLWAVLVPMLVAWPSGVADAADLSVQEERAFQAAVAKAAPYLVRLEATGGLELMGDQLTSSGPSTGIVVSPQGEIVTSEFVYGSQPSSILAVMPNGETLAAKRVATDRIRGLVLLKVEASGLAVMPDDKTVPRTGQWAIAVGRALHPVEPNVSVGVVSAIDRVWGKVFQTDAKISPANYGGVLVDIAGAPLGVLAPLAAEDAGATAGVELYDSGIGFAIPMAALWQSIERLRLGDDIQPGLLGIAFAKSSAINAPPVIDRIRFRSPAEEAKVAVGERVVAVNGVPITRVPEFRQQMGVRAAGEEITLRLKPVMGDEHEVTLKLTAGIPPYQPPFLGVFPARPGSGPAVVREVWPESPAARAGLRAGDVLLAVGETPVTTARSAATAWQRTPIDAAVVLRVQREGKEEPLTVTAAGWPTTVPAQIAPGPVGVPSTENEPARGRLKAKLAGHDRDYWGYVPENWSPEGTWGLVVWVHPEGDTLEAAVSEAWRELCRERRWVLVAPLADTSRGWLRGDLEFVKDLTTYMIDTYRVDRQRVAIHGSGLGARLAGLAAQSQRELYPGVILFDQPAPGRVLELDPNLLQKFYVGYRPKTTPIKSLTLGLTALRKAGYPTVLEELPESEAAYPAASALDGVGRWLETLDAF